MKSKNMRRQLAAMLCAAMLFTHSIPVLAEGVEPVVP